MQKVRIINTNSILKTKNRITSTKTIFNPIFLLTIIFTSACLKDLDANDKLLPYRDFTYSEDIKTVLLFKKGSEMSFPLIKLNSSEKLQLLFDCLGDVPGNFYYTIVHCNSNWKPSDLSKSEYIEGFDEGEIRDYKYSFNTACEYIHYELTFPNEDMSPAICGNYILLVYEAFNPDSILFSRRFYVLDQKIGIKAEVKRPKSPDFRDTGQEVDFSIIHEGYNIRDPFSDIRVNILQNNRYDNCITGLKPLFIKPNALEYSYDYENAFSGGSEYRYFDIKSMRYQAEHIQQIDFKSPYYHVTLFRDEPKPYQPYFYSIEINGKYYIEVQEGRDKHIEADYVYVHFSLHYEVPMVDGDVYIYGALTDWSLSDRNKMVYNFDNNTYEKALFLKQGYYNYEYVFVKNNEVYADNTFFEGSHYETENDYTILVYHSESTSKYEKLIGVKFLNSLRDE
jgi:hypothetical protein